MKFRIVRDYDRFQPQVWIECGTYYRDIGHGTCSTIEEAEKVCADYKLMSECPNVKIFEL